MYQGLPTQSSPPIPQPLPSTTPLPPSTPKKSKLLYISIAVFVFILIAIVLVLFVASNRSTKSAASKTTSDSVSITPIPTVSSTNTVIAYLTPKPGQTNVLDVTKLPLGDGKFTTSPKAGYIYSCQTNFRNGGASHDGDWIHGTTWNLKEKMSVEGAVSWPHAQFSITESGTNRLISGNALPLNTQTGTFPISQSDPAYQIDRNPNSIQQQTLSFLIPLNPSLASTPSCVPMGMIGIALNGVPIFNGFDDGGRDAVAHELQDICNGHPQQEGEYHYHGPSACLPDQTKNNTLIGYALDGFGIYSIYDQNGKELTEADLDECHGITSNVIFNGKMQKIYHYVITRDYPYTIGCFRGTPTVIPHAAGGSQQNVHPTGPPPSGAPRPHGAIPLNNGAPPPSGRPNIY